jgi:hypothetical protein
MERLSIMWTLLQTMRFSSKVQSMLWLCSMTLDSLFVWMALRLLATGVQPHPYLHRYHQQQSL